MNRLRKATAITAVAISVTEAFVSISNPSARTQILSTRAATFAGPLHTPTPRTGIYGTGDDDAQVDEIERLRSMAARLRAEASVLEAEKARQVAAVAERTFDRFDVNSDGEVSLEELKTGLEKELKTEISEERTKELMDAFDKSGDGALQLDEFVAIEKFRNQLESLVREENRRAAEALQESKLREQEALLAEARSEFLNEREPTSSDRILSVLPYLFPLLDGLQYGQFLLGAEDAGANPLFAVLALLYALYRSIPFAGFMAFFALNFVSGNPSINRLVRFNAQQAVFLDIALVLPSLLIGLGGILGGGSGSPAIQIAGELFSDVTFGALLLTLAYCAASSLLGREPDSIPIISSAVKDRMPTIDMFDSDGRFVPMEFRKDEDDEKPDKK